MARRHRGDFCVYVVVSFVVTGWVVANRAALFAEPESTGGPTEHSETYKRCDELEGTKDWTGLLRWLRRLPSSRHGDYQHAFYLAKAYYGLGECQLGDVERNLSIAWVKSDYPAHDEKLHQTRDPLKRMRKVFCGRTQDLSQPVSGDSWVFSQDYINWLRVLKAKDLDSKTGFELLLDIPDLNSRIEKLEKRSLGE